MFNIFNNLKSSDLRPFLYGAVLVFFIVIAVFSSFIISYHLEENCLSSILNSGNCPGIGLAEIEHHLALPNMFSQIIPISSSMLSLLLSVLGFAVLFIIFGKSIPKVEAINFLSFLRKRNGRSFSRISPKTIRWLSLFELSPSI